MDLRTQRERCHSLALKEPPVLGEAELGTDTHLLVVRTRPQGDHRRKWTIFLAGILKQGLGGHFLLGLCLRVPLLLPALPAPSPS